MTEGFMRDIPIDLRVKNMAVEPGFSSTVDKYQGKTAIPLIVRISKNPQRSFTMPMFLVMLSRVTKGSDLGISPIHEGDDLSHLLELEWSKELFLFMNSFDSNGKISRNCLQAAQTSYVEQEILGGNNQGQSGISNQSFRPQNIPAPSRITGRAIDPNFTNLPTPIIEDSQRRISNQSFRPQNIPPPTRIRERDIDPNFTNLLTPIIEGSESPEEQPRSRIRRNDEITNQVSTEERIQSINIIHNYGQNIVLPLIPANQRQHLTAQQDIIRTFSTLSINDINNLTASWLVVCFCREAMGYPQNQYGTVTWTRPDNWDELISHYNLKFSERNTQYAWGANGYIDANYQKFLHGLGDESFSTRLDIYAEKCKDWYKSTDRQEIQGVAEGIFPFDI